MKAAEHERYWQRIVVIVLCRDDRRQQRAKGVLALCWTVVDAVGLVEEQRHAPALSSRHRPHLEERIPQAVLQDCRRRLLAAWANRHGHVFRKVDLHLADDHPLPLYGESLVLLEKHRLAHPAEARDLLKFTEHHRGSQIPVMSCEVL
jgi:hypothetical protein